MKINFHLLIIFWVWPSSNNNNNQPPPLTNNRPKQLLLEASSYHSIGQSNITSCEGRDSNNIQHFTQISFNMKIVKKMVRMQTPIVNPIIDLERPLEKVIKKGEYIAIKCHNTASDHDNGSNEINLPYYGGVSPEEWLVCKDKLFKALDGQCISTGPLRYTFTERLVTGDAKATFHQTALDNGIRAIDNLNKILLEMTKHTFPAYCHRQV